MKPSPRLAGAGAAAATPRRLATPFAHTGTSAASPPASEFGIDQTSAFQPQIPARVKTDTSVPAGARRRTEKGGDAGSITGLFVHPGNESGLSNRASEAKERQEQILHATKKRVRVLLARKKGGWQPEDEEAVLAERRQAQEKEWRKLLRKPGQKGQGFEKSSDCYSQATTATTAYTASQIPAGMRADQLQSQIERNGCFTWEGQCVHYGNYLESGEPPLPPINYARKEKTLGNELTSSAQGNEEQNALTHMSWLVRVGSRP